jgi:Uma2 family endonuclease
MTVHKLDKARLEQSLAAQRDVRELFPDEYLVEEDQMGDSRPQEVLIDYLKSVLRYLYRFERWMVAGNFNHYHKEIENSENLIVPDIALFKGIEIAADEQLRLSSWDMRSGKRQCPPLVLEVSSGSTYSGDINPDKKPRSYGLIGVKEYFSYDPNEPQVYPKRVGKRLLGWRYGANKQPETILPDERGWLWSEELESWLGEDGAYLRLYDGSGTMRPTEAEAAQRARETEQRAREAEQAAKETAWTKLRELGIDPEQL